MLVHKTKPDIECLRLEEINRLLKLSVYDDRWISGPSISNIEFIILVEEGFIRFHFDKSTIWSILYMLNIIPKDTWEKKMSIQRLDHMIYNPWPCVNREKVRHNLILALKDDQLINQINFVNLNTLNQSYWLLTLYNYKKISKYVKNNSEYYKVIYENDRKELYKFSGFNNRRFQWNWNNVIINRSHNLDGMNFYRKVILKIETIYYFQILDQLIDQLTGDVVKQIKNIIVEHLINNLYYLKIQE